jgi:hypothetical protein
MSMKRCVVALLVVSTAACSPYGDRQARLRLETRQLETILDGVCIKGFASGTPLSEVVAAWRLKAVRHFNPYGSTTSYTLPMRGSRPIAFDDRMCSFSVGAVGATGHEVAVLDQRLAQFLARDTRQWRPVNDHSTGHGWCDASNQLHIHSLEIDPRHPGLLGRYAKRTELQVRLEWDRSGWFCRSLSQPASAHLSPYGPAVSPSTQSK